MAAILQESIASHNPGQGAGILIFVVWSRLKDVEVYCQWFQWYCLTCVHLNAVRKVGWCIIHTLKQLDRFKGNR